MCDSSRADQSEDSVDAAMLVLIIIIYVIPSPSSIFSRGCASPAVTSRMWAWPRYPWRTFFAAGGGSRSLRVSRLFLLTFKLFLSCLALFPSKCSSPPSWSFMTRRSTVDVLSTAGTFQNSRLKLSLWFFSKRWSFSQITGLCRQQTTENASEER